MKFKLKITKYDDVHPSVLKENIDQYQYLLLINDKEIRLGKSGRPTYYILCKASHMYSGVLNVYRNGINDPESLSQWRLLNCANNIEYLEDYIKVINSKGLSVTKWL